MITRFRYGCALATSALCLVTSIAAHGQTVSPIEIQAGFAEVAPRGINYPSILVGASFWFTPTVGVGTSFNLSPGGRSVPNNLGPQSALDRLVSVNNRMHERITLRTKFPVAQRFQMMFGAGFFSAHETQFRERPVIDSVPLRYNFARQWSGFALELQGRVDLGRSLGLDLGLTLDLSERTSAIPLAVMRLGL